MKKKSPFLIFFAFFGVCFAQESVSSKEAGFYQRKSVTFLETVIDESESLRQEWIEDFLEIFQNAVKLERFDKNDIPKSAVDDFISMPKSLSVERRMNRTVVKAIMSAVEAQKEARAVNLLSQQQKNSFITDKTKELGITENELNAVMSAAYIFAPAYFGYSDTSLSPAAYKIAISAGGYWWKIETGGKRPKAKIIAKIENTYSATKYSNEEYNVNGQTIDYKRAARRQVLHQIAEDVLTATKNIPDFRLSAQILSKNPRNVVVSIGKSEGVNTDDIFRTYKSFEDEYGNIIQKRNGWIMIKKAGNNGYGLDSAQSKAQIISGKPYVGAIIAEIPISPFEITVPAAFAKIPFAVEYDGRKKLEEEIKKLGREPSLEEKKELENKYLKDVRYLNLSDIYGIKFKGGLNLLRNAGFSQWRLNLSAYIGFSGANGCAYYLNFPYEIDNLSVFGTELSITKKIFFRRLVLAPEIGFGAKTLSLDSREYKYLNPNKISVSQWSSGISANMGIEFALAPGIHLGTAFGYHIYTKSDGWNVNRYGETDGTYKKKGALKSGDFLKGSGKTWSAYISASISKSRGD